MKCVSVRANIQRWRQALHMQSSLAMPCHTIPHHTTPHRPLLCLVLIILLLHSPSSLFFVFSSLALPFLASISLLQLCLIFLCPTFPCLARSRDCRSITVLLTLTHNSTDFLIQCNQPIKQKGVSVLYSTKRFWVLRVLYCNWKSLNWHKIRNAMRSVINNNWFYVTNGKRIRISFFKQIKCILLNSFQYISKKEKSVRKIENCSIEYRHWIHCILFLVFLIILWISTIKTLNSINTINPSIYSPIHFYMYIFIYFYYIFHRLHSDHILYLTHDPPTLQ